MTTISERLRTSLIEGGDRPREPFPAVSDVHLLAVGASHASLSVSLDSTRLKVGVDWHGGMLRTTLSDDSGEHLDVEDFPALFESPAMSSSDIASTSADLFLEVLQDVVAAAIDAHLAQPDALTSVEKHLRSDNTAP